VITKVETRALDTGETRYFISHDGHVSDYENSTDNGYGNGFADFENAVNTAFPFYAWPGGYPIVYVGDGYMLCAKCMRSAWTDETDADYENAHNGEISGSVLESPRSQGEMCDGCNEYIPGCEPHCADCGKEEAEWVGEGYTTDSGEDEYCPKCMANYRLADMCGLPDAPERNYRYVKTAEKIRPGLFALREWKYVYPGTYDAERFPEYVNKWLPQREGTFYAPSCGGRFTSEDWNAARGR
jgi:hypothetical protein